VKFNNILKRLFCSLLTITFIIGGTCASYAAAKTYSFSDLDIEIQVPNELAVFTRSVTSADKNLDLIDTTSDELLVMFQEHGIYLEAFPTDVSYELVVSGKAVSSDVKDFNTLSDSELNQGLQAYREKCESVESDEIFDVTTYKNNSTIFYQTDFKTVSNDITVYGKKYYTVMQGKELNFTVQSKDIAVTDIQASQLKAIVDTAVYKQIDSSIFESPIFTELSGYLFGLFVTVAVLFGIIFVVKKSTKKQ